MRLLNSDKIPSNSPPPKTDGLPLYFPSISSDLAPEIGFVTFLLAVFRPIKLEAYRGHENYTGKSTLKLHTSRHVRFRPLAPPA